ncbi:MAG: hypothetical protein LCH77_16470 [Actinobacteria bacterium]|nr:hypothetical protein [Actinomycetota bacterium]
MTELLAIPGVERAANPYVVPGGLDSAGAQAMFADRSQYSGGFATIVLLKQGLSRSSEDETHDRIDAVFDELVRASGAHDSQRGSIRALVDRIVEQIKIDGQRGEGIALPLSFLVMIVVFGGFVAAGIPVVGAIAAIAGALEGCRATRPGPDGPGSALFPHRSPAPSSGATPRRERRLRGRCWSPAVSAARRTATARRPWSWCQSARSRRRTC